MESTPAPDRTKPLPVIPQGNNNIASTYVPRQRARNLGPVTYESRPAEMVVNNGPGLDINVNEPEEIPLICRRGGGGGGPLVNNNINQNERGIIRARRRRENMEIEVFNKEQQPNFVM